MQNKLKKLTLILAMCMMVAAVLSGCGSGDAATAEGESKVVTMAIAKDGAMEKLDAASYNGPHPIYKMIYDGLVEDGGDEILPQLSTGWEISPDGKTYIFKLREGVKFSDGTDFDADAVIFNMKRWTNNNRHSSLASYQVEEMQAVDKYTVKITFQSDAYTILKEMSYPRPVRFISPASLNNDINGSFTKPVGTGQWMLESYQKDVEFVLVPNPHYWGEKPKVDKIVFKVIPEGESRTMALQSGEVDIIGGELIGKIPAENVVNLRNDSSVQLYENDAMQAFFLGFNQENEHFQDKRVRIALNQVIDKNSLVNHLLSGMGTPADGLLPYNSPYINKENNKRYSQNKDEAKQLLKDAGYQDRNGDGILEKSGNSFEIDLVYTAEAFPEWKTIAEFAQSELSSVGIKANLISVDNNTYDEKRTNRDFDMIIRRTSSDSWMPHGVVKELFEDKNNAQMYAWYDEDVSKLVSEIMSTQNEGERQDKYDELFQTIYEQAYLISLYYPQNTYATGSRVRSFTPKDNAYNAVDWTTLDVK